MSGTPTSLNKHLCSTSQMEIDKDRQPLVSDPSIFQISRLVTINDASIFEISRLVTNWQPSIYGKIEAVLLLSKKLFWEELSCKIFSPKVWHFCNGYF